MQSTITIVVKRLPCSQTVWEMVDEDRRTYFHVVAATKRKQRDSEAALEEQSLPRAHVQGRGKAIGLSVCTDIVVVGTKIARSRDVGIWANCIAFSPTMPIHHTYQCHVLVPLHMLDIKTGSGRWVMKSLLVYCAALLHTQGTRLEAILYCYYNSNVAMVRGVCALESSYLRTLRDKMNQSPAK